MLLLAACAQSPGNTAAPTASAETGADVGSFPIAMASSPDDIPQTTAADLTASYKSFPSNETATLTGATFLSGDCQTSNLTVSTQADFSEDGISGILIFTNQAGFSCTVHGYPIVVLASLAGHPLPSMQSSPPVPSTLFTLQPKQTINVPFSWMNWCGGSSTEWLLMVRFSGQTGYLLVPLQTPSGQLLTQTPRCTRAGSGALISVEPFSS
jgi:hypothetical protein